MLRIEQGFSPSVYEPIDTNLAGYTSHHRLLMPALVAADMRAYRHLSPLERLNQVVHSMSRSATLAMELYDIPNAPHDKAWRTLKNANIDMSAVPDNSWRLARRADQHSAYPGHVIWTATRTLSHLKDGEEDSEDDPLRLRERYTFTSSEKVTEEDMLELLETGDAPREIIIATATVYALNKAIPKASLPQEPIDISRYPLTHSAIKAHRTTH